MKRITERNAENYCTAIGCLLTIVVSFILAVAILAALYFERMEIIMTTVAIMAALVMWGIMRTDRGLK